MEIDDIEVLLSAFQCAAQSSLDVIDFILSSSDSSDEDNVFGTRNEEYFETTVMLYSEIEFKSHFRMTKETMDRLVEVLRPHWVPVMLVNQNQISIEKACHIAVWYLSNQETYRQVGDRFNVERGNCHRICKRVFKILFNERKCFIKWPRGPEINEKVVEFNQLRGNSSFKNVVSCVDGTHINVTYINIDNDLRDRHHNTSFKLQGVCDANYLFTDIFFGYPGSAHDATIWKNSPLYNHLTNIQPLSREFHLIGDSAYPISEFLMKVYPTSQIRSDRERNFNTSLSSSRQIIEQTFGRLKNKFRRLKNIEIKNHQNVKYIVVAACVLHNFIILNDGYDDDYEFEDEVYEDIEDYDENYNEEGARSVALRIAGQRKRDEIADEMILRRQRR